MTSPPQQPTVADAVRLMDSLSFSAGPTPSAPRSFLNDKARQSGIVDPYNSNPSHHIERQTRHSTNESRHNASWPHGNLAKVASPHRSHASSSTADQNASLASLPAEIIFEIGTHFLSHPTHPASFPCQHSCSPYTTLSTSSINLTTLLALSSVSRSFRNTLVPLIWHTLVIRTPQHLPRLAALLRNYDTLSVRSSSPSSIRRNSSPPPRIDEGGLRHPLPHIRSIIVSISDKYIDFDQSYLISLLRSMHLRRTEQLQYLYWSAEASPNPAIWGLLGPSLRSLEVDGRTFYQGHKAWAGLDKLEELRMVGYESTLLPTGVVSFFQAQRVGDVDGVRGEEEGEIREVPAGADDSVDDEDGSEIRRGRGPRESPIVELQTAAATAISGTRRQARHLYLNPPSPSSSTSSPPASTPSVPTPLHTTTTTTTTTTTNETTPIRTRQTRLQHLSLCSSKTSLFHQLPLIRTLCFHNLTCLELFAVTPEPPLSSALITTARTLTHLRLVLDISGAFANFNTLWSDLVRHQLPRLEWLEIDPMPQQNTAPSFWDLVEQCPRLGWINARRVDSFPPCFGAFDPDHSSGALPF